MDSADLSVSDLFATLPLRLAGRCRLPTATDKLAGGDFMLYLMHHTVRA